MLKSRRSIWKDVLNEIYLLSPGRYCGDKNTPFNSSRHSLAKKIAIDGNKLRDSVVFLQEQNLIELIRNERDGEFIYSEIRLTNEGFKIAAENEHNTRTLSFSKILAIAATVQILWTIFMFAYTGERFVYTTWYNSLIILGLIIFIGYLLSKLIDWLLDTMRN